MQSIQEIYLKFMGYIPLSLRPAASLLLAIFIVFSIVQVLKRNFIYLIGLIVLLPSSKTILQSALDFAGGLIKYLLSMAKF